MTDLLRDRLQSSLGAAYTLERELGGGGMSRVFVAEDSALGRRIVVKVLAPELAEGLSAERFTRETRLAARLQHPNVVPVLTVGVAETVPYFTMPFVEGDTLRSRIGGQPPGEPIAVEEAVSILRDVARALAYAHERGVVHRDIKPENVLLTDHAAVVADFGIAKALDVARAAVNAHPAASDAALTQLGTVLGTPAYMAPEQAAGDPHVDARADVYAWGVVGYELLAGLHPFAGKRSAQALLAAHLVEVPLPLDDVRPDLPTAVAALLMRCLSKEPDERPANGRAVLAALDLPWGSVTASVARQHDGGTPATVRTPGSPDATPSVAVLPFANLSADAEDEYFSDGMTEEVLNALAHLPGVRVAARTSAFAFKGQRVDLRTIAEQLRVRTVLEGSVRRSGSRVRVAVQLVSAADGLRLWGERYDREMADVFALQDEIAEAIAEELRGHLTEGGREVAGRAARPGPAPRGVVHLEAYEQYLRGRFLFEQHDHRLVEALRCFERATTLQPDYALAHAWLGTAYALLAVYQVLPAGDAFARAQASADRALALDSALPEALTARLVVALWFEWDRERAESLGRQAVAAASGLGAAHEWLGWALLSAARFAEAEAEMRRALTLDPLSGYTAVSVAFAQIMGGRTERALATLNEALARAPFDAELHRLRGLALEAGERFDEACEALRRARELNAANPFVGGNLAAALAFAGERAAARALVTELEAGGQTGTTPAMMLAVAYHALGDDDRAYAWLERAFEAREFWLSMMHVDPIFRRMRGDARFEALVRRVGVAPVPPELRPR